MKPVYNLFRAPDQPDPADPWDAASRIGAAVGEVSNFRPESSGHRPLTQFKLLWDDEYLHGIFRVEDRYVKAVHTAFNSHVCRDSCVEFFVAPAGGKGYCNLEFNCCGVLLATHIEDETRTPQGFASYRRWSEDEGRQVEISASLTGPIMEEITTACLWTLAFRLPLKLLLSCTGAPPPVEGTSWRANFYKCGDQTSHPHWGAWSPVNKLNFHLPDCFGTLVFRSTPSEQD